MTGLSSGGYTRGGWTDDVFLRFRGEDTRRRLTGHLYSALKDADINLFRDNGALSRGEMISSELLQVIEEPRISIVVFSTNHANSRWCLKIIEVKEMHGQLVLPVFYDIDPSEVWEQTSNFARAFAEHKACFDEERDRVSRWRTALTKAGHLSGWDLKNVADRKEAILIEEVVK
ncbi:ADP-ribosyl cyclase/cyclic ADP-ribose hydrolase [Psidium guajava]|nr:ADP-ribosyl cyclase/cyclic ADP-ribose hydrolase [Psidium guajava]